jgi:hypothetical protein
LRCGGVCKGRCKFCRSVDEVAAYQTHRGQQSGDLRGITQALNERITHHLFDGFGADAQGVVGIVTIPPVAFARVCWGEALARLVEEQAAEQCRRDMLGSIPSLTPIVAQDPLRRSEQLLIDKSDWRGCGRLNRG